MTAYLSESKVLNDHLEDVKRDVFNKTYGMTYEEFLTCIESFNRNEDVVTITVLLKGQSFVFAYTKTSKWRFSDWNVEFMGERFCYSSGKLRQKIQEMLYTKPERMVAPLRGIDWYYMYIDDGTQYNAAKNAKSAYLKEIKDMNPTKEEVAEGVRLAYGDDVVRSEQALQALI